MNTPNLTPDPRALIAELRDALADCVVKSTEYGSQDGGFVASYVMPTGPIHRAIPLLEWHGVIVRPGFDGRAAAPAESTAQPSVVSTEGSGQRCPSRESGGRHGCDLPAGHDGMHEVRVTRFFANDPAPGPWTGPRPTLTASEESPDV